MMWWLLVACPEPPPPVERAPAEVTVQIVDPPRRGSGTLSVQVNYDNDLTVDLPTPAVDGLDFLPDGPPIPERIGTRTVLTQNYRFGGKKGSYEIPPLVVSYADDEGERHEAQSRPLFVDIQTDPPREAPLSDIADPPRVWAVPWRGIALIGGAALLGLGLSGGLLFWGAAAFRKPQQVAEEPPDVAALRRWDAVRRDDTLPAYDKAVAINLIFREYAQIVLAFPATAWTTTETVAHLRDMKHLPEGNVPRAKRLLRATDLIKFADADAGDDLLDELDADLRAFIGSTRPRKWEDGDA